MMETTYLDKGKIFVPFPKKGSLTCTFTTSQTMTMESMTQTSRQLWDHHRFQVGFCTFLWDQLLNTVSRRLPR